MSVASINERLERHGWVGAREDFDDLLADTLHDFCPDWTDDELKNHPPMAMQFCDVVRRRANVTAPDDLILRALSNIRRKKMGGFLGTGKPAGAEDAP